MFEFIKTGFNKLKGFTSTIRNGISKLGGITSTIRNGVHKVIDFADSLTGIPIIGPEISALIENPITMSIVAGIDIFDDLIRGDVQDIADNVDLIMEVVGIPVFGGPQEIPEGVGRGPGPVAGINLGPLPELGGGGPRIRPTTAGSSFSLFKSSPADLSAVGSIARN
jgi:hypothetical protein